MKTLRYVLTFLSCMIGMLAVIVFVVGVLPFYFMPYEITPPYRVFCALIVGIVFYPIALNFFPKIIDFIIKKVN